MFGLIPLPYYARILKRYFKPYPTDISEWWLDQGIEQLRIIESAGTQIANKVVLELGTGWQPIIPILFFLKGAQKIFLIDSQRLIDKELLVSVIDNLKKHIPLMSKKLVIKEEHIRKQLYVKSETTIEDIFDNFNMKYLAPYDARDIKLPDNCTDIITSRAVLEHISPAILEGILAEFRRILKGDGVMCHIIDNSDHWEHKDRTISRLNFLKYEDWFWRLTSINPLDYQNRMRHYEYLSMLNRTGFQAIGDYSSPDESAMMDLRHMKVCTKYKGISHRDLAILTSMILAKKC
jgi:SAM-dependent methyltransferase